VRESTHERLTNEQVEALTYKDPRLAAEGDEAVILALDQRRLAKCAVWLIEQQKGIVWQNRRARRA
jgi:hypothetical protein